MLLHRQDLLILEVEKPTKLYDSTNENVINTHFKWMSQYGIDGAAIQRFAGTIKGRTLYDEPQNTLLYKMQKAAENNNSLFYIMYDISGGDQIKMLMTQHQLVHGLMILNLTGFTILKNSFR